MRKELYRLWLWLAAPQQLHYINGADTLPPPLPPEQEREALAALARGQTTARDLLITHNLRLVVYIAKKFETPTAGIEDMISIGTIGLIKAVNTFEPTKNIKLATYASRCIENEILMYLRKSSNRRQDASIDEPLNTDTDGNELLLMDVLTSDDPQVGEELERSAERAALRGAVGRLSPRERRIMELRFGLNHEKEHTQKEVADTLGISQSYISRLEKRIIRRLRRVVVWGVKNCAGAWGRAWRAPRPARQQESPESRGPHMCGPYRAMPSTPPAPPGCLSQTVRPARRSYSSRAAWSRADTHSRPAPRRCWRCARRSAAG